MQPRRWWVVGPSMISVLDQTLKRLCAVAEFEREPVERQSGSEMLESHLCDSRALLVVTGSPGCLFDHLSSPLAFEAFNLPVSFRGDALVTIIKRHRSAQMVREAAAVIG